MNQAICPDVPALHYEEIDWELIFESPDQGFIPLVEQAQSIKSLKKCTTVIITKLFTRKSDAVFFNAYLTALDEFLPTTDSDDVDVSYSKRRIIALLRDIKKFRQRKAAECAANIAFARDESIGSCDEEQSLEDKRQVEPLPDLPGLENAATEQDTDKTASEPLDQITPIFADTFCDELGKRLKALHRPIEQNRPDNELLPFVLSEGFEEHFLNVIRLHLIPSLLKSSRGLVKLILEQPEDQRRRFLSEYLESRNGRQVLWEKWQDAWKDLTQQEALPPKPKGKQKKSLLDRFSMKKEKKVPAWLREKTPEEWKAETKLVKAKNKIAAEVWAEISKDTGGWIPPEESHEKLLVGLFARSTNGLQKQISGLIQIVNQGESVGRLLTGFARGKDIDLALLAASYQEPDAFVGTKTALKDMMVSYTQKEVDEDFTLVSHFLSDKF